MAWVDQGLVSVGEVIEALWGQRTRNNDLACPTGLVTTAGDMVRATGLNAQERVAVGANGALWHIAGGVPGWLAPGAALRLLQMNAGATAAAWVALTAFAVTRKTADETVTNSAVLQNDDHLLYALAANTNYMFVLLAHVQGVTASADLNYAFTVPAGATARWGVFAYGTTTVFGAESATPGTEQDFGTINGTLPFLVVGTVRTAGTAGNLQFQWAQAVAEANDLKVLTDSLLLVGALPA